MVDGKYDMCSQGKDINFTFKGFGIAGKVIFHVYFCVYLTTK